MADALDILDVDRPVTPELTKERILNPEKKPKKSVESIKRPEGMNREVFALLYADAKDHPPLLPTDTAQGYKEVKVKLGMRRVRPWQWMPFVNPARKDGAVFHHWRRIADQGKEYPFAKFNKKVHIPKYTDSEYDELLVKEGWSKDETNHLFELCERFDLRFVVVHDRWDRQKFLASRSIEDLKARYYEVVGALEKKHAPRVQELSCYVFDIEHERKRKEQLEKLLNKTQEELDEEQMLLNEVKKIESRKKERDKKTQELQKLISAAGHSSEGRKSEKVVKKKTSHVKALKLETTPLETGGIKFPEVKGGGVMLRSQRMKLPSSVGQKKTKTIEQLLQELHIDVNPMATEEICQEFNDLRSDMVLLYDLKVALASCEFELQTLKHQYEVLAPGRILEIPAGLTLTASAQSVEEEGKGKGISEILDVAASPSTPTRKQRKAALEQGNVLKKLKMRT